MKRTIGFTLLLILAGFLLVPARPASALAGGQDDRGHAYTGLATDFEQTCAAAALSESVILTAADCFSEDGQQVFVTLDGAAAPPDKPLLVSGEWIVHPDACIDCPPVSRQGSRANVAVVILDEPLVLGEYARLPGPEEFEALAAGSPVDVVGYDLNQFSFVDGLLVADFYRRMARSFVLPPGLYSQGTQFRIRTGLSDGQNCFMSAGSPVFGADGGILLGLLSGSHGPACAPTAAVYPLNQAPVIQFLQEAVNDPVGLKARHD